MHPALVLAAQGAPGVGAGSGDRSAVSPAQTVYSEMCLVGPAFLSREAPLGAPEVTQSDCELVTLVQPIQQLSPPPHFPVGPRLAHFSIPSFSEICHVLCSLLAVTLVNV